MNISIKETYRLKTHKNVFFLLVISFISISLFSKPITSEKAKQVGKNFFYERINQYYSTEYSSILIKNYLEIKRNNKSAIFIVNFQNNGYVIVSGDDAAIPILAYDFKNNIDLENVAPAFEEWINGYANQIEDIWEKDLKADKDIALKWKQLDANSSTQLSVFTGKSQLPLLLSDWDQGGKYNALCPADQFGPGGHAYAGCVAIAMAQVMYYYKYPSQGNSSYSYYHQTYGLLSANFGTTTYKWNEMANKMPTEGNFEIAQLLYHCGVSVDMNYTASGSGAWSNNVVSSLKDYFGYSSLIHLDSKSSFTTSQWSAKIIQSIDDKVPLYYHGYPASFGAGHAFNLDGYQGSDYFHFNWGWSGSYNGYFYLNNLNPGGNDFSTGQGAIFDIKPSPGFYPEGCQSTTAIGSNQGVLFDGSGPGNYSASNDCRWLISPVQNIDYIEFTVDRLDLALGDTLFLYDGASTNDSLIGKISGTSIPSKVSLSGNKLLVRFVTDNQNEASGFDASFKSILPVFCQGTLLLTDSVGYITDGSDSNNYNNGIMCKWLIESPVNQGIAMQFTKFNTELNKDWVKVYDPTVTPSLLLGQFSGNQLPPIISASNGKMLIVFASSESDSDEGWEAYYFTGNVGFANNKSLSNLKVFPNPAQSSININGIVSHSAKVQLFSMDGILVYHSENITDSELNIDTRSFVNGIYMLRIFDNGDIIHRRIEIQH